MFFDLHSHCLPGIDDGAVDEKMSLLMLEQSARQGVELCVATPHYILRETSGIDEFLEKREKSFETLLREQKKQQILLPRILLGAEVYLDNDISKFKDIDKLCIEGTRVMLIELPEGKLSRRCADWLYNLTLINIHPLLAHIERYSVDADFFRELSELDVDYQINANLFLTVMGRRKIKKFLSFNHNYIVSSDMHNNDSRCCNLLRAYDLALSKFGESVNNLFYNNASQLLKDKAIPEQSGIKRSEGFDEKNFVPFA